MQQRALSAWAVMATQPGWAQVVPTSTAAVECAKAANGEYWEEVITDLRAHGNMACFTSKFATCILRDEGDELCAVSYAGSDYRRGLQDLREAAKAAGFLTIRLHTDDPRIIRYWKALGITPNEFIYRETL